VFFFQAEDGIRDFHVTGVQTCALPIFIMNQTLSVVLEQTAQALPLEQAKFGILVSPLTDKTLLEYAQFVLAVSADLPAEDIRKRSEERRVGKEGSYRWSGSKDGRKQRC